MKLSGQVLVGIPFIPRETENLYIRSETASPPTILDLAVREYTSTPLQGTQVSVDQATGSAVGLKSRYCRLGEPCSSATAREEIL
jgi:hypothetical protein